MTKIEKHLIHKNFHLARKQRSYTLAEVAEMTESSLTHCQRVEKGQHSPRIDYLANFCEALDVDPLFILGVTPEIEPPLGAERIPDEDVMVETFLYVRKSIAKIFSNKKIIKSTEEIDSQAISMALAIAKSSESVGIAKKNAQILCRQLEKLIEQNKIKVPV